jgi:butyryl-CoA dehydrogenase
MREINRIFEGTNEINRHIITGFLLEARHERPIALMPAIKHIHG